MNISGKRLYIQEVSTRDGFQIEPTFIPTDKKVAMIDALSRTGLAKIEVTSFSSPKAIPALADAEAVLQRIARVPGVEYAALVPNVRGCERALKSDIDEINVVMSASQSHNRANLRMSCEQSLAAIEAIVRLAHGQVHVNASLSTAFGCPFDGEIADQRILEFVDRFEQMGIDRVTLCDTTGMANPSLVSRLFTAALARRPRLVFAAHFHNTRGMGLANALAALQAGIDRFDASLGGLGGCPFAPGASGNVCTEDLVHMFDAMGAVTGVDLQALVGIARKLPALVGHDTPGQVMRAGAASRRYPTPDWFGEAGAPGAAGEPLKAGAAGEPRGAGAVGEGVAR